MKSPLAISANGLECYYGSSMHAIDHSINFVTIIDQTDIKGTTLVDFFSLFLLSMIPALYYAQFSTLNFFSNSMLVYNQENK